jgi:hypothetical protein
MDTWVVEPLRWRFPSEAAKCHQPYFILLGFGRFFFGQNRRTRWSTCVVIQRAARSRSAIPERTDWM